MNSIFLPYFLFALTMSPQMCAHECGTEIVSFHDSLSDSSSFPLFGHSAISCGEIYFLFNNFLWYVKMDKNEVIGSFSTYFIVIISLSEFFLIFIEYLLGARYFIRCFKCFSLFNSSNKLMYYYLDFMC